MNEAARLEGSLISLINGSTHSKNPLRVPLQLTTTLENSLRQLAQEFAESPSNTLETASRLLVYRYSENYEDNIKIDLICTLLDTIYLMSTLELCEFSLVHILLEELMEIESTSWCHEFWIYIEARESLLTPNLSGVRAPGTTLIRMCNSLVRRLSKSKDSQFSGRIAMFLARAFPLNEKSGLNIRGSFNVDNVTIYQSVEKSESIVKEDVTMKDEITKEDSQEDVKEDTKDQSMQEIDVSEDSKETRNEPTSLFDSPQKEKQYNGFWKLQEYFSNPTKLFDPEYLKSFSTDVNTVISFLKFREYRESAGHRYNANSKTNLRVTEENLEDVFEEEYVPKWLTSPELFDLQLSDKNFRNTVYTQIYIICDFLLNLTEAAKAQWPEIGAKNNSIMYAFTLDQENAKNLKKIQEDIVRCIGHNSTSVKMLIARDRAWQVWKLRNCPPFDEGSMLLNEVQQSKEKLETFKQPRKPYWHAMGTAPLSKLWKVQTGLDKLKGSSSRFAIPDPKFYAEKIEHIQSTLQDLKQQLNDITKAGDSNEAKEGKEEGTTGLNESKVEKVDEESLQKQNEIKQKIKEETAYLETVTWQGLRAAKDQGLWSMFGKIDKAKGFLGLFEDDREYEEQDNTGSREASISVALQDEEGMENEEDEDKEEGEAEDDEEDQEQEQEVSEHEVEDEGHEELDEQEYSEGGSEGEVGNEEGGEASDIEEGEETIYMDAEDHESTPLLPSSDSDVSAENASEEHAGGDDRSMTEDAESENEAKHVDEEEEEEEEEEETEEGQNQPPRKRLRSAA